MAAADEYCLFWIRWWPLCMTKAEWSGWMQAIGAVAAIVAAGLGIWWQLGAQRAQEMKARTDEAVLILTAVASCRVSAMAMNITGQLMPAGGFGVDELRSWAKLLRGIPLLSYPDAAVLGAVNLTLEKIAWIEALDGHTYAASEQLHWHVIERSAALIERCDVTELMIEAWLKKQNVESGMVRGGSKFVPRRGTP